MAALGMSYGYGGSPAADNKINIYQLYFKEEHRQYLNPLYIPYDNTANPAPTLREYPLLKDCCRLAIADGADLWGGVSWNYNGKFSSVRGKIPDDLFHKHILSNPGYDAYFFNPFTNHVPLVYNVWEQGQWCHPHIIAIMEKIYPLMGIDAEILTIPQGRREIFWGSMVIANSKFWSGYIDHAEDFIMAIEELDPYTKNLYSGSAGYVDNSINYFSFIQERLMATYLANSGLKVMPFHINEDIAEDWVIQLNALKDGGNWTNWLSTRNEILPRIYPGNNIDWASWWIKSKAATALYK